MRKKIRKKLEAVVETRKRLQFVDIIIFYSFDIRKKAC